uniref:Uncharacterized protein n=1 Tax=Leersia perrieri TaxID=77586 RepID=A0A0D9XZ49_9ORYZ
MSIFVSIQRAERPRSSWKLELSEGVGSEFAADAHAVAAVGGREWYDYVEPEGNFAHLLLQPTKEESLRKQWTHRSGTKTRVSTSRSTLRSGSSCGVELRVLLVSIRP